MDVLHNKELRYLPKTEVDNLEIRYLRHSENVLLVRKKYLTTINILNAKLWILCGGHGVVTIIIGQPGISKKLLQITVTLLTGIAAGNEGKTMFRLSCPSPLL